MKRIGIVGLTVALLLIFFVATSLFAKQHSLIREDRMINDSSIRFQNASSKQQYVTVFLDDFNELDRNIWTFHSQKEPASGGRYNSRFFTNEDNVYIDNGCLVLDCSKTANENDGTYRKSNGEDAPVEYIAPYISSCDRFAMSEGKISARIKVSKGIEDGLFPFCFWTFGQNSSWPYAHEMDIMEASTSISSDKRTARDGTIIPAGSHMSTFASHLHVRTSETTDLFKEHILKLNWAFYNQNVYEKSIDFISSVDPTEWHIYSVEWDKNTITYFVDEKPFISYDAKTLGAINATGEIGFFYPQDIRFNIKAGEKSTDQHGYMFIDWVKAEAMDITPCTFIGHKDVNLITGGSLYINPDFNDGCINKVFSVEIKDDGILSYNKYANNTAQMVVHRIIGKKAGETLVTLRAANGRVFNTFKVTVK